MEITLTWKDLIELGNGRKIERDGFSLAVARELLPTIKIAPNGATGSVTFRVDAPDPIDTPTK
jgi:hypothetical protein